MSEVYPQLVYEDLASFSQRALDLVRDMSESERAGFAAELQRTYGRTLARLLELQDKPNQVWTDVDVDFARILNNSVSTLIVAGRWVRVRVCKETFHWRVEDIGPENSAGTCFRVDIP
jgi:hypothetical protein